MFRHDVADSTAFLINTGHRAGGEAAASEGFRPELFPSISESGDSDGRAVPDDQWAACLNVFHHFN
jgi:hypothetical protein